MSDDLISRQAAIEAYLLREKIQLQLLSITALCYGDNPDLGEPDVMLEWKQSNTNEHSEDKFRDMWDECLGWVC